MVLNNKLCEENSPRQHKVRKEEIHELSMTIGFNRLQLLFYFDTQQRVCVTHEDK